MRAFGPGLEGGVAKLPAIFYVETNGDTDQLGGNIFHSFPNSSLIVYDRAEMIRRRREGGRKGIYFSSLSLLMEFPRIPLSFSIRSRNDSFEYYLTPLGVLPKFLSVILTTMYFEPLKQSSEFPVAFQRRIVVFTHF